MDINRYIYHPTNGTSVDLYVEFDANMDIIYYKVMTIWDETGDKELDKSTYDLSWITFELLNADSYSA